MSCIYLNQIINNLRVHNQKVSEKGISIEAKQALPIIYSRSKSEIDIGSVFIRKYERFLSSSKIVFAKNVADKNVR